jgi:hypothetical protein
MMTAPNPLLEISGHEADGGELVGRRPTEVPSEILSRYYAEKNSLRALRARCLDCCCGSTSEVRKCVAVGCPSWPFRMGVNPFRKKRVLTDAQKAAMAERLRDGMMVPRRGTDDG